MTLPQFVDIILPGFAGARIAASGLPDLADCRAIAAAQFASLRENIRAWRDGKAVFITEDDPSAVSNRPAYRPFNPSGGFQQQHPTAGGHDTAGMSPTSSDPASVAEMLRDAIGAVRDCAEYQRECILENRNGGTPQSGCPPVQACGATPLGFNTFEDPAYPLTGAAVGTMAVGREIEIKSGRAQVYQPQWLYLSARDVANGFAEVQGYIITAKVNEDSQLAGDSLTNRPLVSDIYRGVGPLQLDNWLGFTNTAPLVLKMAFGHALGPSADVAFAGSFFGQASAA